MLTFMWNCTHTWCYVRDGVGWGGMLTFMWSCTHSLNQKRYRCVSGAGSGGSHIMKTSFGSVALKWPNFDTCKRASENHPLGATLLMFFIFLVTCSWSTEKVARVLKIRSSKKTSCCNKLHSSRKQTKWKEEHFTWENTCNQASSALMCLPHLRLRLKTWQTDAKLEKNFRASCNVPKLK